MVASNRELCIQECLKWEGGYSNDAADPGGPTNWGITIIDARKYWKKDATAADVKAMPKSVAIDIYTSKYWKTPYYDCNTLASGVDLSVFDFGVNSGPARAKKYLDQSVGGSTESTVIKLNDARLAYLKRLGTWPVFGKGWGRRVAGIKAKSLELAAKKPAITKATGGVIGAIIAAFAAAGAWVHTHRVALIVTGVALAALIGAGKYLHDRRKTNA